MHSFLGRIEVSNRDRLRTDRVNLNPGRVVHELPEACCAKAGDDLGLAVAVRVCWQ